MIKKSIFLSMALLFIAINGQDIQIDNGENLIQKTEFTLNPEIIKLYDSGQTIAPILTKEPLQFNFDNSYLRTGLAWNPQIQESMKTLSAPISTIIPTVTTKIENIQKKVLSQTKGSIKNQEILSQINQINIKAQSTQQVAKKLRNNMNSASYTLIKSLKK